MARKNEYGKYIISAGEIGAYTVCPEAWRLRVVERTPTIHSESIKTGNALHEQWAKNYDEFVTLNRSWKVMVFLIAAAILIFVFS